MAATAPFDRTRASMDAYRLRIPVLLAPMAGACPPALSVALGRASGMGACGALLMQPTEIAAWAQEASAGTDGPFQMNLWILDPPPARDPSAEAAVRAFLGQWGPEVPADAGDGAPLDFAAQCQALLDARPAVISSIRPGCRCRRRGAGVPIHRKAWAEPKPAAHCTRTRAGPWDYQCPGTRG